MSRNSIECSTIAKNDVLLCFNFVSRFQELKDAQLTEHKRLMDLLDAERDQILTEKAKLETMERLKQPSTLAAKRKTELDAAIQIAQVNSMYRMCCETVKIIPNCIQ